MKHYIKLIRAKNLLIVVLTQYLMRYSVILPILQLKGYESQFGHLNFFFLVLATVFLTAAGYVINDYFDTKTDLVNRPQNVVVGKFIQRRSAMILHIVLNTIGIAFGFYISYQIGIWKLGFIFIVITALLWFYSSDYKRRFLIGNITVAFLTALVPMITVLYEIPPLNAYYSEALALLNDNFMDLTFVVFGFSIFALITTLMREIIKDAEDVPGDKEFGRRTVPLVFGMKTTKIIINVLNLSTLSAIIFVTLRYLSCRESINGICMQTDYLSLIYIGLFLFIPYLFLAYKINSAQNQKHWHFISIFAKTIMLFGVLYAGIFYISYTL